MGRKRWRRGESNPLLSHSSWLLKISRPLDQFPNPVYSPAEEVAVPEMVTLELSSPELSKNVSFDFGISLSLSWKNRGAKFGFKGGVVSYATYGSQFLLSKRTHVYNIATCERPCVNRTICLKKTGRVKGWASADASGRFTRSMLGMCVDTSYSRHARSHKILMILQAQPPQKTVEKWRSAYSSMYIPRPKQCLMRLGTD